jgi:hypothetical protein
MSDSNVIILIVAIVGAIIIGVGVYFLLRFLRGTIKVHLTQTAFNPGEVIKGKFDLHVKKPIHGKRLVASLIGTQHVRSNRKNESSTRTDEVFRQETVLESDKDYRAGVIQSYDFTIPIPDAGKNADIDHPLAKTLVSLASMANRSRIEMRWKVEARLEAKGIDLVGSKKVNVNNFL